MRIKEEFKRSGDFWLPSVPDRVLPGTLSISDGGDIELEIAGLFSNDEMETLLNDDWQSIERIVGHIEKDGLVTLDDCYYKTGTINLIGGRSKSLIHVSRVFTGVAYDEGTCPLFNTLTFSVEGIDEWVGISGIKVGLQTKENTATISYQQPTDISLYLNNNMQLLIVFDWKFRGSPVTKEAGISQKTYFKLVSKEARELADFVFVVHKITTLLCFAIDKAVSLDSMSATADNLRQDFGSGETRLVPVNIYYSSRPYSKDEPKIHQHDMLFGFGQIQGDAERKINDWIKAYEYLDPTFDLYFSAQTGVEQYLEVKFLTLAQGLEAFHRRKNGGSVSFGERIECIIKPFEAIIGNQTTREKLISRVVNTRNYLTHYDSSLKSKTARDESLWSLCLKMELLFQLHFLQLIGFSQSEIGSIITNYKQLRRKLQ
ncbi:hypothetical protein C6502_15125 [Candidatus Poribacteria bacterium]|nr:MAG: hypothetical protein C6502_15125 [Candidatus Poribacteria bacterium]